jgi:hypothetical protein
MITVPIRHRDSDSGVVTDDTCFAALMSRMHEIVLLIAGKLSVADGDTSAYVALDDIPGTPNPDLMFPSGT